MIWQNLLGVGWKKIQGCGAKFRAGGMVAKIIWEVGEHFFIGVRLQNIYGAVVEKFLGVGW